MLQLENLTPFAANMAMFPNEHGIDTLYIIVKASFHIGEKWTLLEEQIAPTEADAYYGEPETSSLKYASDFHIGKPSTDVVMCGLACAPGRKNVTQLDVRLKVGALGKTIRVYGNRQWNNGRITPPEPFSTMPMIYENAYGGVRIIDNETDSAEQRNPVGKGYAGGRKAGEVNGLSLPNLEDPYQLIRDVADKPAPACFGFVAPGWEPRMRFVGTYDEAWQSERAPYLPVDFDKRFLNMAHPDMVAEGYLKGGEPVSIVGMHPSGELQVHLPKVDMKSTVLVGSVEHQTHLNLETILFEPNKLRMSMVWRAALPCDKNVLKIKKVKVALKR